ncbi:hypothetical protein OAN94_04870 [Verrucomicrobiales bacterium]|nr:hypothetical protein [Verrucomicrobiales bacterium]MDB4772507.1 hypothetical protein [Verrucomicrobiales bacterium]MDC0312680.1 hypothetical protein [Verrucomicrobiales bacterium]MDC0503589.1 hypothetical protein [Verrucomicrobiales bacterium]MDF1788843.1 hypothetical protein [Verrucomicrobiales bacterium]
MTQVFFVVALLAFWSWTGMSDTALWNMVNRWGKEANRLSDCSTVIPHAVSKGCGL